MTKKNLDSLRRMVEQAKAASGRKRRSNARLRSAACRAVRGGLPLSEVALASGFGMSAIKNWMGQCTQEDVRVLAVHEEESPPSEGSVRAFPESPVASLEFGAFSLRLFVRAGA